MADIDVAIVGAGACGLTAATALREAGIGCLLLERDATPSGSTALSSGFIPAAGTRWQREAGVHDSPEAFAADIQAKAKGRAAPHLVQAYTEASAPALDLLARHGVEFELLDGFLYPGHHARRMHALRERTGAALMAALQRAAQADILTEARVVGLQPEDQGWRITAVRPDGATESLTARAVLLACNGFGGNPAMVREFLPEMRDALFAGHAGNDGTAIHLGTGLGAATADLGGYQGHGSWVVPQGALMTWAVMMQGGVQLNAQGRRFHDETAGYSEAAVHVLAQPGGVAWNVFAAPQLALARGFPDFRDAEAAGALREAADLGALARVIGCADLDLGGAELAPPYYAVKVTGALFHTQGGLDIDHRCRVRRTDGSVFPTLFAAGGAARGVSGDAVWGYLSGNGLLSAVAGGFIAARTITEVLS
ncbi:MAG: FAD-dependent oxidoreductase [Burkholderiaceae bacterium]|nr:FAD-dependent oxidoreductase [Burkholderiaceae bacterium]